MIASLMFMMVNGSLMFIISGESMYHVQLKLVHGWPHMVHLAKGRQVSKRLATFGWPMVPTSINAVKGELRLASVFFE